MKDKLQLLIDSEDKITRSGFAKMLGINPATISQIMAGRNNPSYELLQRILQRFPNVSSDWLMLDRGQMLRDPSLTPSGIPRQTLSDAAADAEVSDRSALSEPAIADSLFSQPESVSDISAEIQTVRESHISRESFMSSISAHSQSGSPVERVVVFYADKTFETYTPKN